MISLIKEYLMYRRLGLSRRMTYLIMRYGLMQVIGEIEGWNKE